MQLKSLTIVGILLWTASCAHKVPLASQPPSSSVPVAAATAPSRTVPVAAKVPQQQPSQVRAQAQRPNQTAAKMTTQERATLNERLARLEDALFDYDKTTIRSDATNALRDDVTVIRGILENYPKQRLLIEGHADERGSAEYNLALGDRRARAAEEFLSTMGVPKTQLSIISFGKERPVCTDQTENCWQRNRRAHITAEP